MKIILTVLLAISLYSCGLPYPPGHEERYKSTGYSGCTIITIDSCEYIQTSVYAGSTLCHKGNCKNPIHNNTVKAK
jgi:hypothetical protein